MKLLFDENLSPQLPQMLANYKVPQRVFFVDELPRNTRGKVQKNLLRSRSEYQAAFSPGRQS